MNKKFFTLLVALLATIGFGAFAQVTVSTVGTASTYDAAKLYLLETKAGNYLKVVDGELVTVTAAQLAGSNYAQLQAALWKVTATPASSGQSVSMNATYEYANAASDIKLSLATANAATTIPVEATTNQNVLGGDIDKWIGSSNQVNPQIPNYFYVTTKDQKVITMGANAFTGGGTIAGQVVPVIYNTLALLQTAVAGATGDEVLYITPRFAGGILVLSANDVNTYLGKKGVYEQHLGIYGFYAEEDSYIQLSMDPTNTLTNPMTKQLQAQGVDFTDDSDGLIDTDQPISFKGAALSYRDISEDWVALKDVESGNYLVVDTVVIHGTELFNIPKMETTTDKWYGTPDTKTTKRLADSYLYQFTYNATNNTISIASKAYRYEGLANNGPNREIDGGYLWSDASTLVSDGSDPGNVYQAGKRYNVITKLEEPLENGDELSGVDLANWLKENPFLNYFTYANLPYNEDIDAVVYTWGEEALTIKLTADAWYTPKQLTSDVYNLQIVGSSSPENLNKYLKMSLDGVLEREDDIRRNYKHMPSAQWVLEATNNKTARIYNREFDYILSSNSTTYEVKDEAGAVITDQFFYLGGDTLRLVDIGKENKEDQYLGYYNLKGDEFSYLNRFSFEYLHELLMDQPVGTKDDALSTLEVKKGGQASNYTLVKVGTTNQYGYGHDETKTGIKSANVAQLVRDVYRVAVYETLNSEATQYVTYDANSKRYHLTESEYEASEFLLKENNEVAASGETKAKCYYTLLEAPVTNANFAIGLADDDANEPGDPIVAGSLLAPYEYALNFKTDLDGQSYYVAVYDEDEDDRWEVAPANYLNPLETYNFGYGVSVSDGNQVTFDGYTGLYAESKVSVDNNTLVLTNGVLGDHYAEVANSAFALARDTTALYRTLGLVEDEVIDETVNGYKIKIFRANATTPEYLYEDANSANYSIPVNGENNPARKNQHNFLGVEGKGDSISGRAALIARYVRGTVMPQYLLMVDYEHIQGSEYIRCELCEALIAKGLPPIENCQHDIPAGEAISKARVLVNLNDSIAAYTSNADKNKFRWNSSPRLAFVDATFREKSVDTLKKFTEVDAYMSLAGWDLERKRDTIFEYQVKFPALSTPKDSLHTEYLHAFRLIDGEYSKNIPAEHNDFLIETSRYSKIAEMNSNIWIKVQNGVPVMSEGTSFNEAILSAAERWNLEATTDTATSNTGIESGAVKVIAGQGSVTIKGAAGQQVAITNILGQTVYNGIVASDEVTVAAPAGVVVVSVAGEATKALVK